jgi:ATP-dependent 26S proteasome regulatory subunit
MQPINRQAKPNVQKVYADFDLEFLRCELARIDVLVRCEVRRWQLAGQDPADAFRGLYISPAQADTLQSRPIATSWGQTALLPNEEHKAFQSAFEKASNQSTHTLETCRQKGYIPRLAHLAATFQLTQLEQDVLLICLAPALDLRYERLYGYLQDDVTRKRPTVNLVMDLLGDAGIGRFKLWNVFSDDSPLFHYELIEKINEGGRTPLLSQALVVDNALIHWLLGEYQPRAELGSSSRLIPPQESEVDRLVAGKITVELKVSPLENQTLIFHGPDQACQEAAARLVAVQLRRPLLVVDLKESPEETVAQKTLHLALRDARLNGALLFLTGFDAFIAEDGSVPAPRLTDLFSYPGSVIVSSRSKWQAHGMEREHPLIWQYFDLPNYAQRRSLWSFFLSQPDEDDELGLDSLAGQFQLTSDQIQDASTTALNTSRLKNATLAEHDIYAAARNYTNPNLSHLARKIRLRYSWDDIILPADQIHLLQEIVDTVRGRSLVLETWGVGEKLTSSAGVAALFAGQPGTGKTMAAEIIAAELGLDLYKIDLATVVSKYIGETEKNIEKIFKEAERSNVILFFDEADALFGKRSEVKDAHDRYANIEISYLLQRMESYDGVTILATNLRANLDEAFTRRLQFLVDFPFPDEADRLRIWQALFPGRVPRAADLDFPMLARRYKMTGANIRNVLVNAAYLAAADSKMVTMSHLLHATFRELQKMGRLVKEEDITHED